LRYFLLKIIENADRACFNWGEDSFQIFSRRHFVLDLVFENFCGCALVVAESSANSRWLLAV
jgi:hypothetical protein